MDVETFDTGLPRLVSRSVAYGDESHDLRVWVAHDPGDISYYYVPNMLTAAHVITKYGDAAMAAGCEQREDGEWSEWYNEDGDGIDEAMENKRI